MGKVSEAMVLVDERAASAAVVSHSDEAIHEGVREYLAPVVMALLCVIGMALTASRLGLLLEWSERYDGGGEHVVSGCAPGGVSGGDSWECTGALVVDGSQVDVRSDLVSSRGALASSRPFVGERTEVFFDSDDLGLVHPVALRLNEMARLYLSLLPRLLLVGGTLIWLLGWALTRHLDTNDLLVRDTVRIPGRFVWQRRGVVWLMAAVGFLLANHLLTGRIIGSLGTF